MGNGIHGLITTRLKYSSSIQGIQDVFILFFSVFSTSFHCMGQNKVVLRSFYGTKCPVPFLRMGSSKFT